MIKSSKESCTYHQLFFAGAKSETLDIGNKLLDVLVKSSSPAVCHVQDDTAESLGDLFDKRAKSSIVGRRHKNVLTHGHARARNVNV